MVEEVKPSVRVREYLKIFDEEVKPPPDVEAQFIKNQEQSDYWGNSKAFEVRLLVQPRGVFNTARSVQRLDLGCATLKITKTDTVERVKASLSLYIEKIMP